MELVGANENGLKMLESSEASLPTSPDLQTATSYLVLSLAYAKMNMIVEAKSRLDIAVKMLTTSDSFFLTEKLLKSLIGESSEAEKTTN